MMSMWKDFCSRVTSSLLLEYPTAAWSGSPCSGEMPVELHRSFHQIKTAGPELQHCSEIIYTTTVKYMTQTTLKDVPMMYKKHFNFVGKPQLIGVGKNNFMAFYYFFFFFTLLELLFRYIKIINQIVLGIRVNEMTFFGYNVLMLQKRVIF